MSKLIIIDSSISDINLINNFIKVDLNDTYDSLLLKIESLNISSFHYLNIVKGNDSLINNDILTVNNVENDDPNLTSWENIINFFNNIRLIYNINKININNNNLRNKDYNYIIRKLNQNSNIYTSNNDFSENLLLIDSRLNDINADSDSITNSLTYYTDYIIFNYFTDTFDTIYKDVVKNYKSIGLAQHNYFKTYYQFVNYQTPSMLFDVKNNYQRMSELHSLKNFLEGDLKFELTY